MIFYCQDIWKNKYSFKFDNLVAIRFNLYFKNLMKVVTNYVIYYMNF
jgi:hypothetical protein